MIKPNLEEMLKINSFSAAAGATSPASSMSILNLGTTRPTTGPAEGATTQPARGKIEFNPMIGDLKV